MRNAFQKTDAGASAHEHVYRGLRSRIMHGQVSPGTPLTLRGVGQEFGVSMTPSREAIRRLAAEGALSISASGRISTPELSNERIEELSALRALIEVELASRALPRAHLALIDRLEAINGFVAAAVIYSSAKAGLSGFTKSLAKEVGSRGITVNSVAPGFIETDMTSFLDDDSKNNVIDSIPLNRFGDPKDVAELVAFLASEEAGYITGQTISVDGGLFMH